MNVQQTKEDRDVREDGEREEDGPGREDERWIRSRFYETAISCRPNVPVILAIDVRARSASAENKRNEFGWGSEVHRQFGQTHQCSDKAGIENSVLSGASICAVRLNVRCFSHLILCLERISDLVR